MSAPLTPVEHVKAKSQLLRGSIAESLSDDATGALIEDDTHLVKFHGFYQQDDRDLRAERIKSKLEPAYSFMIRVRVPGGVATPAQWLAMNEIASHDAERPLRLTTRQTFQLHGVIKRDLKTTLGTINKTLLDTLAACGDVNRNVMCSVISERSPVHRAAIETAAAVSAHLTPRTRAYHELWVDGAKVNTGDESEPIYGPTYLPRKFKIAVAIPPVNDVDVFAQDLGLIAIAENDRLVGFNVAAGGGMGRTHGEPETYPRLADVIGFCEPDKACEVAEHIVEWQRDFGDRTNRKHARLKYTIDDRGLDTFKAELAKRLGYELQAPRPYEFTARGDQIGWMQDDQSNWHLTLFIPEGRIEDRGACALATGLKAIAEVHQGDFRITPNQNLTISKIKEDARALIESLLSQHGLDPLVSVSPMRAQALACVALPNCPLAFAEAERYLPSFTRQLDTLLAKHGLANEPISVRLSGCANGCSRPYVAEVALVGKAPGSYNLMVGGDAIGARMNKMALESAGEDAIFDYLDRGLEQFSAHRQAGESFGDFTLRALLQEDAE